RPFERAECRAMSGQLHASRDLLFAFFAREARELDGDQLIAAAREWSRSPDRTLTEILAASGALDPAACARLKARVDRELGPTGAGRETIARITYAAEPVSETAGTSEHATSQTVTTTIEGRRFKVLGPHARGGLGEVFRAFDGELKRSVALKELQARRAH